MPTMNRVDMLNCAAGHHDFSDDASECHVCGFAEAEASAPPGPEIDVPALQKLLSSIRISADEHRRCAGRATPCKSVAGLLDGIAERLASAID